MNGGSIKSRADGVRAAKGKYITIIDGDDALAHKDILNHSFYVAEKGNIDVIEFQAASFKNKKREREKIIKLLRNNLKIKIPTGKRKSNAQIDSRLNINNIEKIIKNHTKERKDSFGNKISKENKKNVHISFKDKVKKKKLIELIPIESFKSFNIMEKDENKKTQSHFTRCCSIF